MGEGEDSSEISTQEVGNNEEPKEQGKRPQGSAVGRILGRFKRKRTPENVKATDIQEAPSTPTEEPVEKTVEEIRDEAPEGFGDYKLMTDVADDDGSDRFDKVYGQTVHLSEPREHGGSKAFDEFMERREGFLRDVLDVDGNKIGVIEIEEQRIWTHLRDRLPGDRRPEYNTELRLDRDGNKLQETQDFFNSVRQSVRTIVREFKDGEVDSKKETVRYDFILEKGKLGEVEEENFNGEDQLVSRIHTSIREGEIVSVEETIFDDGEDKIKSRVKTSYHKGEKYSVEEAIVDDDGREIGYDKEMILDDGGNLNRDRRVEVRKVFDSKGNHISTKEIHFLEGKPGYGYEHIIKADGHGTDTKKFYFDPDDGSLIEQ